MELIGNKVKLILENLNKNKEFIDIQNYSVGFERLKDKLFITLISLDNPIGYVFSEDGLMINRYLFDRINQCNELN